MSVFPVMESLEGRTSSPVSADVRLMMSHSARTADGHTDDPTGASSQTEAFPAAEESSPTEKRKKKKGIAALFQRMRKALFTLYRNEDDAKSSDSTDVQPDLSGIKGPGPSELESEIPGPSGSGAAFEKKEKKKKGICAFLRRFRMRNKVAPYSFAKSVQEPSSLVEPKPVPGAPDVEPVPGPSSSWPPTGSFSSFYEVKRELGSGGSGIVYEGMRRFDGQKVAIKFLLKKPWKRFIELPGSTEPLLAEVAVNLLLRRPPKSPYIVQMLDWFEQMGQYVLIMEYPHPCVTLYNFTIMCNGGFLDETVAQGLMRQAVLAAKHCIDCGVDHNDMHTGNILVNTETLQLKLIDFGLSQLFQTSEGHKRAVQVSVWCLGKVLLEMVSGDHQYHILQSGKCDPQCPSLSNECRDLIKQCLDPLNKSLTLEQILEHPWFDQN